MTTVAICERQVVSLFPWISKQCIKNLNISPFRLLHAFCCFIEMIIIYAPFIGCIGYSIPGRNMRRRYMLRLHGFVHKIMPRENLELIV